MTVVYTFGEDGAGIELDPGVYQFDGDIRCGAFLGDILSDIDGLSTKGENPFKDGAKYTGTINGITYTSKVDCFIYESAVDVTVTAYIGDEPHVLLSGVDVDTVWKSLADAELLVISDGECLKKLEIKATNRTSNVVDSENPVTNPNLPIDIKNMSLIKKDDATAQLDKTENNLLSGVTVSSAGDITVADAYLHVPERAESKSNFVVFTVDDEILAKTYYVSFDVRVSEDSNKDTTSIRPQIANKNVLIKEAKANGWPASEVKDKPMNAQYVVPVFNDKFTVKFDKWSETATQYYPVFTIDREWAHYEGQFTPTEKSDKELQIAISKGPGSYVEPIDIANFKVWTKTGTVYSNDFKNGVDESVTSKYVTLSSVPVITTVAAVTGMNTMAKYDTSAIKTDDGTYTFKADISTVSGTANAVVEMVLSDGTTVTSDSFALSADKSKSVSVSCDIESGVSITSVNIKADASVTLTIVGAELTYREADDGDDIPNIGIIMVLLLKKRGGAYARPVKTEFIVDGKFNAEPVIYNEAAPKVSTVDNAGWYAKDKDGRATSLSYVTEDGNSFIRVTDLDTSQRGVYYNTGVTLEPGTYTVTMDMRISETEESEGYNAKKWRNLSKSIMQVRANLGDPNNAFSAQYGSAEPVDLDTMINASGTVYGNCQNITREWTTYTDTIVIDQPILAVFKIGGGTGGESDSHGFDIDNVSIIGYVTPKVEEAPATTEAPAAETEAEAAESAE